MCTNSYKINMLNVIALFHDPRKRIVINNRRIAGYVDPIYILQYKLRVLIASYMSEN